MWSVRLLWLVGVSFTVFDIALAEPRPDFAVNGVISGATTVSTSALDGKALFASMTSTVVNLQGGYNRLATVKTALNTIATQLSSKGQTLMQAIATLSTNNSGPIATYFDAVTNAITALRALLTGGLTTQLNTITTNVNNYISSEFTDSFTSLSSSLMSLSQALATMRTAVQNARNSAGSANPIPAATMRRFVTTRVLNDVSNAVRVLNSDLPVLEFIVRRSLASLQTTDQYLLSITAEAQLRAQEVSTIADTFGSNVQTYVNSIKTDVALHLNAPYVGLEEDLTPLDSTLQTVSTYQPKFDPIFQTTDSIYTVDPAFYDVVNTAFSTFIEGALVLDDDQLQFYGSTVCTSLQDLIQVLIENSPSSPFCFSKNAQKVFNMFLINTFDVTDCYRLQMTRFDKFHTALLDIVRLIVHDIEDFIELLDLCLLFSNPSTCITYLGDEYATLFALTTTKRGYLERLLRKELEASLLRLKGCISNSKHLLILDGETMEYEIAQCKLLGNQVG